MKKLSLLAAALLLLGMLAGCTLFAKPVPTATGDGPVATLLPDNGTQEQTFTGDWYGWWSITKSTGVYAGMDNGANWWDACMQITADGRVVLWDEKTSQGAPLATLQGKQSEDTFTAGCMLAGNGTFLDMPTKEVYWILNPNGSATENLLQFTGTYEDAANPGSGFEYTVVLRPWGVKWTDVAANQLPYHYERWYLPLLESNAAMPERIG